MKQTLIKDGHQALLYENGVFKRVLEPGKHVFAGFFDFDDVAREVVNVDVRERSTIIKNQEILTSDKVTVRLSLLVYFKVVDPLAAVSKLANFEDRIYEDVQLSARRFLATRSLDQLLLDRNDLSNAIKADVAASLLAYGIEILRADVKDFVFPGQLKDVMNKVIETSRQAEATLIATRARLEVASLEARSRAEVARVDSLARAEAAQVDAKAHVQTQDEKLKADARLLELLAQHPLLVKLKELEMLERIGSKGNNHFYVGVDPREHGNSKAS